MPVNLADEVVSGVGDEDVAEIVHGHTLRLVEGGNHSEPEVAA